MEASGGSETTASQTTASPEDSPSGAGHAQQAMRASEATGAAEGAAAGDQRRTSAQQRQRTRDFDRSIRAFNLNPKRGIKHLIDSSLAGDGTAQDVAAFLHGTRGLNKRNIGDWLGEFDPFHIEALQEYCGLFSFGEKPFLDSMREILSRLRLPGEAQKIDRILEAFAKAYHDQNPGRFQSPDTVHTLAFSTVMLNVDQHNPNIQDSRRMTKEQFVRNNRGIDGGSDLPRDMLEALYDSIKAQELLTVEDRDDQGNLFTSTVRQGWMRKQGGKYRSWQRRYFILTKQPAALYYFRSETDLDPRGFFMLDTGVTVTKTLGHKKQIELTPAPRPGGLPASDLLKSAKFKSNMEIVQGRHKTCILKGLDEEDAMQWVVQLELVIREADKLSLQYLQAHGAAKAMEQRSLPTPHGGISVTGVSSFDVSNSDLPSLEPTESTPSEASDADAGAEAGAERKEP